MIHKLAIDIYDEDNNITHIVCTCGEMFQNWMPPRKEWVVTLFAKHLKKENSAVYSPPPILMLPDPKKSKKPKKSWWSRG